MKNHILSFVLSALSCFGFSTINDYNNNRSMLFNALVAGDLEVVKPLIEKLGPAITFDYTYNDTYFNLCSETRCLVGYMPIHVASLRGHLQIVQYLIEEKKVDVNVESEHMQLIPLYLASEGGHCDVVRYLLHKGGNNKTALHIASEKGHIEIVKILIENGANIDGKNNAQETALYYASKNKRSEVVRYLIDNKANIHLSDSSSKTPLYWIAENEQVKLCRYFLKYGALLGKDVDWVKSFIKNSPNTKMKKIDDYFEYVREFDNSQDKVNFISLKLLDPKINYLIQIALHRILYILPEKDYGAFCVDLWEKINFDKKLRDIVFNEFKIDKNFAITQYHDYVITEVQTSKIDVKKEGKGLKILILNKCKEIFRDNLYKRLKNSGKSKNNSASSDITVSCLF